MKEEEIEFFETRIPILKRHYALVSEFNGQINEEETKKLFIYIRQLQKDNRKLKEENKSLQSQLKAKEEENGQLKDRINKAIEYMKPRFMNCIDNDKRYFEDNDIQEIYEILKEDNKEKVDEKD